MLHIAIDTASLLRDQFRAYGRDQFTYSAYEFFIEELDGELDVIAVCCDWDELDYDELIQEYDVLTDCEDLAACLDELKDHTWAVETDNKILFQMF